MDNGNSVLKRFRSGHARIQRSTYPRFFTDRSLAKPEEGCFRSGLPQSNMQWLGITNRSANGVRNKGRGRCDDQGQRDVLFVNDPSRDFPNKVLPSE